MHQWCRLLLPPWNTGRRHLFCGPSTHACHTKALQLFSSPSYSREPIRLHRSHFSREQHPWSHKVRITAHKDTNTDTMGSSGMLLLRKHPMITSFSFRGSELICRCRRGHISDGSGDFKSHLARVNDQEQSVLVPETRCWPKPADPLDRLL